MNQFKYDLAISFAGEQRQIAEALAKKLDAAGYAVFYDRFEAAELWGRELTSALGRAYAEDARYCLILASNEYVAKAWTNLERQNALGRFIQSRGDYVLCVKIHPVVLPGLPSVIAYVDYDGNGTDGIYKLLLQKLGRPDHAEQLGKLSSEDTTRAREIVEACFRRAVFTRMDSEIGLDAMYQSLGDSLGRVQRIVAKVIDPSLQRNGLEIVRELDAIERTRSKGRSGMSNHLPSETKSSLDERKRNIVRLLLEIRRAARLSMQLPLDLETDHFYSAEEANAPPRTGY